MNVFRYSIGGISCFLIFQILCLACTRRTTGIESAYTSSGNPSITTGNPVLPGYYADPEIIESEGKFYIYATIDPWGSFEIAVWESPDFKVWTLRRLNWPTRDACTSTNSDNSMVSSPCVTRADDGKFYMHVTAGSEIWAGISDHPLGPWYSMLPENQPMIANLPGQAIHSIGADCFIDDDGTAYLYWGSGWNWQNGHCYAARLHENMHSLENEPLEITPPNYFEAPNTFKVNDRYYMLYSDGRCIDSTYKIRYAISDHPFGPWLEGKNSPILRTTPGKGVIGPGQPSAFVHDTQWYLVYHRIEQPDLYSLLRQICVDSIEFDSEGFIEPIIPSENGIIAFLSSHAEETNLARFRPVHATSELSEKYTADAITDAMYGTKWVAADSVNEASITIDLGKNMKLMNVYTWFEYAFNVYHYLIEYSKDNRNWKVFSDKRFNQESGSPRFDSRIVRARYIRMTIFMDTEWCNRPAIWEISVE